MRRNPVAFTVRNSLTLGAVTAVALSAVGPVAVAHAAPRPSYTVLAAPGTEASLPPVLADVEALDEPILSLVSLEGTEGSLPAALANVLPSEVTAFFLELTDEDKSVLKDLASKIQQFNNEDELLAALKEKSPKLYEKAVELRNLIKEKIDSLKPEAKAFVQSVIEKVRGLHPIGDEAPDPAKLRETVQEIVAQFNALSGEAKSDLAETFPKLASLILLQPLQGS
ncbi:MULTISPECIES: hypothetical protein [unclassified Streptomyces]|uniref:hypothetical protein n=1 Tax=Streptomyces TaxID=1883 RepID=UPI00113F0998|nr:MULTISPECIES: hypothetical protein [unclassified Streptomyces]MCE3030585.1 hypothetical protein [Streptomyces sp. CMSTAAHL-2]TGZ15151.1 hypothetical protein DV517_01240 [Streptomyces sp. S816]